MNGRALPQSEYTTIPDELGEYRQWVVWRYEEQNGRLTKVPYKPLASVSVRASSTDRQSWGLIGAALAVVEMGSYDGIGFVVTKDDPYIGIDLDYCLDAKSGVIAPWAREIVDALNSYTERTPSGEGLRVWCKGRWHGDPTKSGGKRGDIEMYAALRFFTVTGKHLEGTPLTIEEKDAEVLALYQRVFAPKSSIVENSLSTVKVSANGMIPGLSNLTDAEIVNLASHAANSSKFLALWQGNIEGYASASEADAALCSILAFYTSDPSQIERLFSQSKLYRDKWANRPDYRRRTIELALSGAQVHYSPSSNLSSLAMGPSLMKIASSTLQSGLSDSAVAQDAAPKATNTPGLVRLSDVQPEPVRWLWHGRIALGKLTIIDGDPGLGKSLITCDLAARLTTNAPMPDGSANSLQSPAGVLFLSAEDGLADTIRPRLDAAGADVARIGARVYVSVQGKEISVERLPTLADIAVLEADIAAIDAKLVVIDPLMAHLPDGVNANRDQDIRRALTPLSKLAESTGVAIVVVRHLNKLGGGNPLYRGGGSIGIIGAARCGLLVAADPDDESDTRRVLAVTKSNLAAPVAAVAFRLVTAEGCETPHVQWEGATSHTSASLLSVPKDAQVRDALSEAVAFLRTYLADGPQSSDYVKAAAGKEGISGATLTRAKLKLGIDPRKEGFGKDGLWLWELPKH